MFLYDDFDVRSVATDATEKLEKICAKNKYLRKYFKLRGTVEVYVSFDECEAGIEVAFLSDLGTCDENFLASVTFADMPGVCSTIVAFDATTPTKSMAEFIVDLIDELMLQSKYSCMMYTLLASQRLLRQALEKGGFTQDHTLTHKNDRTGNKILFYHKHYHQ